jgi:hypothetical protein
MMQFSIEQSLLSPIRRAKGHDHSAVPEGEVRGLWNLGHTRIVVDPCNFQPAIVFRAVAPNTYKAVMKTRRARHFVSQTSGRILTNTMAVQLDLEAK